jgi:hypothetical protein
LAKITRRYKYSLAKYFSYKFFLSSCSGSRHAETDITVLDIGVAADDDVIFMTHWILMLLAELVGGVAIGNSNVNVYYLIFN